VLAYSVATASAAVEQRSQDPFSHLPRSELRIVTDCGAYSFQVWIAADDQSRSRGLMHVREMPADHGMLFLVEVAEIRSVWMMNTWISLELIFIGADGVIVNIVRDARPMSLDPILSTAPAKAVLELVSGSAERIGLDVGDRIEHPALAAQSVPVQHTAG
jgi:uncharacterized membrane protein (UPF0127 family)